MSVVITCERVHGAVTVQDGGRRGHMHEGVPPGGALVPELLARANRRVGNAWDAPALEVHGRITLATADDGVRIATEHGVLEGGTRWSVERARYVAARGGFDVPELLGGRGSLVAAGIGARIVSGDTLRVLERAKGTHDDDLDHDLDRDDAPFRIVPGPDLERFDGDALRTLLSSSFETTAASDRVGARLRGPRLERASDAVRSMPMVRGAIEVPAAGEAIVLGPDHPTTGGYPVLATIIRADLGRFFALATRGASRAVRFVEVSAELARDAWREHRMRHGMLR